MYLFDLIILIDDDPINNLINKRLISRLDISPNIVEFSEAEKALEYIKSSDGTRNLILLDINMPVMNGWDFLSCYVELQDRGDECIIMLSSSIDHQDRQKSRAFGCVKDFIEKPLTREKLAKALKKEL
jgi:CheY-like chemotaxis protein